MKSKYTPRETTVAVKTSLFWIMAFAVPPGLFASGNDLIALLLLLGFIDWGEIRIPRSRKLAMVCTSAVAIVIGIVLRLTLGSSAAPTMVFGVSSIIVLSVVGYIALPSAKELLDSGQIQQR